MRTISCVRFAPDQVPARKRITHKDPRKHQVVALFKAATGATVITSVSDAGRNRYHANCLRRDRQWEGEGFYELQVALSACTDD